MSVTDEDRAPRSLRQRELVEVAARLFAQRGYHAVSVADVCGELGLSGPAFYRHYRSKQALLVAVLDESITAHLEAVREIATASPDPATTLTAIVAHHVDFVFDQTGNITIWRTDFANLPPSDRSRLRYLQRLYTGEWVRTLRRVRPELDQEHAKAMAHAAIALLQSPTEYASELSVPQRKHLLVTMATAALTASADAVPQSALRSS